jgi:alpha-galactosidase
MRSRTRWILGAALVPVGATAGVKAQIWDCSGGTNQQWTLNSDGTVRGVQSGLCLDVDHNLSANGTAVLLWTCTAAANQRWSRL